MTEELDFDAESARLLIKSYKEGKLKVYIDMIKDVAMNGCSELYIYEELDYEVIQQLEDRNFKVIVVDKNNYDDVTYKISW